MAMADASWWGDESEFDEDIQARLKSDDPAVRKEAQQLLAARNARSRQGRNPFGQPAQPDAPQAPQQAARRPFNMQSYQEAPMSNVALGASLAAQGGNAQARHLQGMINDTQDAIQDENDSRVAQLREQNRMAHEMNMEAMRQEALLQRLAMEERERERDRILQKQLTTGVTTRKYIPGSGWVDV